jgi:hypothetical protein
MPEKRLLFFTANQVAAFSWKAGHLEAEAVFGKDEDALLAFSGYVADARDALYYVLADVVEEDFHQETIPYLRGKDRRTLLGRKLAQRYRDLSLVMSMSLGYETGPRKEEKILFSSFTNTQQFHPWLNVLQTHEARLVGVYSIPLLSPQLGRKLGLTDTRYLLISRQKGGMRQSLIDEGRIRFSRLGQIEGEDMTERARKVATEVGRIQQFLLNTRLLPRDAGPLTVVVLTHKENRAAFEAACTDNAQVRFVLYDVDEASQKTGLKSAPEGMQSERLFLQVLATSQPADQFSDDTLRRFYHLWRARVALFAAGAAVFAFCALFASLRLADIYNVRQQSGSEASQAQVLSTQYSRLQAQFPKLPATADNLKALVANYAAIERQTAPIDKMLAEVSRALSASPAIELEKLDWRIGVPPAPAPGARSPAAPPAAPAAPPPVQDKGGEREYHVIEISARVNVAQASDYRNITMLVSQFVEALRARPGVEVISTRLPFDLDAEKSITGDIGAERRDEIPRFTVIAARRLSS